jgi:DNA-binding MarR family transcriptional regulator
VPEAHERRLPPLLRRSWFSLNQAFRRRIAHLAITPDQFTALRHLHEAGEAGLSQSQLTGRMSSDPNTIASLVNRMDAARLIARVADARDRRIRRLRLKPAGRVKFAQARAIALNLQAEVLACLPARQKAGFLAKLERVAEACRAAAEDA